ncbi:MAG: hypothetical protein H6886_09810 [Hyphomicrobiaceae bacterium]|nr:hypothetical protein [Hyphomicrobiaceae bacterium]
MSAGYDAEVADLFRDLRAASNLTEADLAARISTPVEVVQALEQGAIYALPPWPETCRVVSAYGTLLNLDTRPLLRRIYAQLEAGVVELGPKPVQDVPVMVPPAGPAPAPARAQPLPQGQPAPQRQPQAPAWPNGSLQPQPAPQASPRPPSPQPQSPYPQAPQPQAPGWPNGPVGMPASAPQRPAPQPQAAPLHVPQPQAPRPQAQQPHAQQPQGHQPQALQPQAPLPRAPQPQTPRPQAPQAHPGQPQPAPPSPGAWQRTAAEPPRAEPSPFDTAWPGAGPVAQPGLQHQPAQPQADAGFPDADFGGAPDDAQFHPEYQGYAPDPSAIPDAGMADAGMPLDDAGFPGDAGLELEPELVEEPKKNFLKSPLLKWGIIGLVAVGVLLGLWMFLGSSSGDSGLSSGFDTSDPVLDPDDPRSRKADRLPNNF